MTAVDAQFRVHPSVVFKLGQDLITDEVQALAELVKNAYDADATHVIVRIHTDEAPEDHPDDRGFIEVVDDGFGMNVDTFVSGWLTISNSMKRDMKAQGRTTKRGRTPMGDKGLGRLGAQRLGNRLSISSTPTGTSERNKLSFDWRDFEGKESLNEVHIRITSEPGSSKPGTQLIISDLYEPQALQDRAALSTALSKLISPYADVENFRLFVKVDGEDIDLAGVDSRIREAAAVRYSLDCDGETLTMRGQMKLAALRPNAKSEREEWARVAEADEGAGLISYLTQTDPRARDFKVKPGRGRRWWLEFSQDIHLDALKPRTDANGPVSPGPFSAQIDSFNMSEGSVEEIGVFDKAKQLRETLKEMHGIRVYRDGFNVRVSEDWLGLGKQVTSGGSWYGLRVGSTLGYVAISSAANGQLTETTDREGFSETPAFYNFKALLNQFVKQAADVQELVGRGVKRYSDQFAMSPDETEPGSDELLASLTETLTRAASYVGPLQDVRSTLEVSKAEADTVLDRLTSSQIDDPRVLELIEQVNRLSRQASKASELVNQLEDFVAQVSRQQGAANRLQANLDLIGEQLTLTYETMAVGLTAESISHEIGNIAERLARRSTEALRIIKKKHPDDRQLLNYVNQVQGTVAGLRRQLAHLAPSLRYVRERREEMAMSDVLREVQTYFETRWDGRIQFELQIHDDFRILMNRGKLLQVLDNLILNSEYWLYERARLGKLVTPKVTATVSAPLVSVEDNGSGVDPQVEESLFEAFASKKPRGQGRGLGLFIVRQLLDAEGCEVELGSRRNKAARRYIFNIDLTSVIANA